MLYFAKIIFTHTFTTSRQLQKFTTADARLGRLPTDDDAIETVHYREPMRGWYKIEEMEAILAPKLDRMSR